MKKLYFLFLLFSTATFYGQIVNIPDANFKNRLVNTNCASLSSEGTGIMDVDTNNNGEIEEIEAAQIQYLNLDNSHIASLEGIGAFINLRKIFVNGNDLTSLNFSNLNFLTFFQCASNQLTSIVLGNNVLSFEVPGNLLTNLNFIVDAPNLIGMNVSGNLITVLHLHETNIQYLHCNSNLLTSISTADLPPNLIDLQCNYNQLTQLSVPNTVTGLSCDHNQLTSIDLTGLNLTVLSVSYNQLTNLEIPSTANFVDSFLNISGNLYTTITLPNTTIGSFQCNDTHLTSLTVPADTGPFDLEVFQIQNNLELKYINLRDSGVCIYNPDWVCMQQITGNTALQFACIGESYLTSEFAPTLEYIANLNNPNMQFTSYCAFTPAGSYNTLNGNIKLDIDANGCTDTEAPAASIPIKIERLGQNFGSVFSNTNGNYATFSTSMAQTTITPQFENPYYSATPASYTSSFVGFGNTETANFCITPNGVHNDLEAGLIPITPARPGFDATYKIVYKNKGTTTQSGSVTFSFNDYYSDFVSASSPPSNIQPYMLTWNFNNLAPFETREITIVLNVNSPIETPAVNAGDILIFNAQVASSSTDETYMDNYANLSQVTVGSLDPNDKQVSDLSYYFEYADTVDLYYTIRFQNLGTFAAENVVVSDVLSDKLNASKLQMVASSHPYVSKYNALTRKLELIFEGINLPAAIDNEPESHGFVSFKIKPISTITTGQTIENNANIYFDFNAPVATNTTATIIETILKTNPFDHDSLTLHPNPAKNTISIDLFSELIIQSVFVYNTLGQLVKTLSINPTNPNLTIDVTDLKKGTYFIEISTGKEKSIRKFIKQ